MNQTTELGTGPSVARPATLEEVLAQMRSLEQRIVSLENVTFKRSGLAAIVRRIIGLWPGPFTQQQIAEEAHRMQPDLVPPGKEHLVHSLITKMERAGTITCKERGAGRRANIYQASAHPPQQAGKPGSRFGSKSANESGFRSIVRAALPHLPEEFTIEDLRQWVGANLPEANIPYGSWSSTLYKLQAQQELIVIRGGGHSKGSSLKVYGRGPKKIAPTGEELSSLQDAWREFRAKLDLQPVPELLMSGGQRHE